MADFIHGAEVDEEGFLVDLGDWTKEICETMASDDDVILTDEHWDVLNFLRNYYEEYQVAPAVRVLTKQIKKTMGKEKGNSKYLYALFPYGPGKQGCRFAGLPKPTGCI
jgi:tRNA 2-thiouridine synthesizing protein E